MTLYFFMLHLQNVEMKKLMVHNKKSSNISFRKGTMITLLATSSNKMSHLTTSKKCLKISQSKYFSDCAANLILSLHEGKGKYLMHGIKIHTLIIKQLKKLHCTIIHHMHSKIPTSVFACCLPQIWIVLFWMIDIILIYTRCFNLSPD